LGSQHRAIPFGLFNFLLVYTVSESSSTQERGRRGATHLAALWDDPALLDEAEALVSFLPGLIDADTWSDVVAGAAGCLVCLLRLWEQRPTPATLAAAVRCGERLLARAVPMASGIGWRVEPAGPVPLAGMSHGAAGIAWALLQLAAATGDRRFREAAEAGLAYERSLYVPERRNWPDLRSGSEEGDGSPSFLSTWCHGAAGIALARLDGLRYLDDGDDGTVREEIAIALETTLREGFGRGHCQCHGDLGNLEPLLLAQDRLGLDLAPRIGRLLGGTLADQRACGWRFGMHGRTEPPGFMLGLAGSGMSTRTGYRLSSCWHRPHRGGDPLRDLRPRCSRDGVVEGKKDEEEHRRCTRFS